MLPGITKACAAHDRGRVWAAHDAVQPVQPLERAGIWQGLLAALAACADPPTIAMVDSTAVRAHRSAAGAKRGQRHQAIGRLRGGSTTKIHPLADGAGRLYAVMLTAGQVHDIQDGRALLARVPPMCRLIADQAYDADDVRDFWPPRAPRR